jgi:MFS family permease
MPLILTTAFLDILGLSIFLPVLPTIIAGFGVNPSWTGYTQAFYALGMFLWGLFFGRLSDTFGRRKMLTYTSIINFVSYIIMLVSVWTLTFDFTTPALVSSWESIGLDFAHIATIFHGFTPFFLLFLLARFVWWLGGAGFWVIQAYISDISSPENKTKNMGYIGAAFGMAFLIGPAIGGLLSQVTSIQMILVLCSIIVFINILCIFIFLKEPKKHVLNTEVEPLDFHFSPTVMMLLLLSFWTTLAFAAIQSMSTQFYTDRFHFDATSIGYTMAMVGIVSIVYQGFLVKYVRRFFDDVMMIRIALFLLTFGFVGFAFNTSPYLLYFWIAFFPLGMGSFQPSVSSLIAQNAGNEVGKVMGYNTSIQSIGQIIGPLIAGFLYLPGSGLPFLVSAGIFFVLFFIGLRLHHN